MRKKITGEEAAIALLKGEKIWHGNDRYRLLSHPMDGMAGDVSFGGVEGQARECSLGRITPDVLTWTDCEIEVPEETPHQLTCPVCGTVITKHKHKRAWANGVRVITSGIVAFAERMGPDELTISAHCAGCGANIETRAEYYPKPKLPKLPNGYSFRDTGDAGTLHLFSGANDIGCAYSKEDRDAYVALVELWDQEHASSPGDWTSKKPVGIADMAEDASVWHEAVNGAKAT